MQGNIYNILAVFIGSGLGGVCRWVLGSTLNGHHSYGTLLANVAGCFILGILSRHVPGNEHMRLLLMTGFCGGFTTFSTFINEDLTMLRGGQLLVAIAYMAISLALGMLGAWFGYNCK